MVNQKMCDLATLTILTSFEASHVFILMFMTFALFSFQGYYEAQMRKNVECQANQKCYVTTAIIN